MSIQSIGTEGVPQPSKSKAHPARAKAESPGAPKDTFKTGSKEHLLAALRNEPDVRPEAVERGKALATNPNYPSAEILEGVAKRLLGKPSK